MVIVFALGFQVQRDAHCVGERAEEVLDHLGAEVAYALVGELGFIFQVRAAGDIQRAAGQTFVHRQHKAKAVDAALIAERHLQRLAERQTGIFHGVVIVDIQIALHGDVHAETAVGGNLIQHVVEEADAGVNFAAAFAVQPHFYVNLRFTGITLNMRVAVAAGELFANHRPVERVAVIAQAGNAHVGG